MRLFILIIAALVLLSPAPSAQEKTSPPEQFLGVLELPLLCWWDCPGANKPIPLFLAPDAATAPALLLSKDMLYRDPKNPERDSPHWPKIEEYSYERSGAIVYERRGENWYRIRIGTRDYWVSATHAGTFLPYPQILDDRLTYLSNWNFILWNAPGKAPWPIDHPLKNSPEKADKIPVRVLGFKQTKEDGRWWIHVEIQKRSPCENLIENVLTSGWVPAYSADNRRTVWYYPRGC